MPDPTTPSARTGSRGGGPPSPSIGAFAWVVPVSSSLVVLIALLVLVGWALDIETLKRIRPELVPMMPFSAVGILLGGISLALLRDPGGPRSRIAIGRAVAGTMILLGTAILLQFALRMDFGIDRLLFPEAVARLDLEHPGRAARNTTLAMILSGASLLLMGQRNRGWVRASQILALSVLLLALPSVVGYLYAVEEVYGFLSRVPMAFHTAIGFLILGLGLLFARPDQGPVAILTGDDLGGRTTRSLLPAAVLLPLLLGWLRLRGQEAGLFDTEFGTSLLVILMMTIFSSLVWWNGRTIHQIDAARARLLESEQRARKAEEAGRRRTEMLLESAAEGIYGLDVQGRCTFINPAGAEMLGYTREEVVGHNMHRLIHDRRADGTHYPIEDCPVYQGLGAGERIRVSGEFLWRKDGLGFPAEYAISPILEGGRVLGGVVTFTDITERVRAEEALLEAKEAADRQRRRFEAMLESTEDFIYLLDPSGRFQYANRAILELWGLELPEVVGKDFAGLRYPPELVDLHRRQLDQVISTRSPVRGENPYTSPAGETGHYEYIFVPVFGDDGSVEAIAGVTRNATERRRAEAERERLLVNESEARDEADRRANKEQALSQAIGTLAATFSVQEAIRVIIGSAMRAMDATGAYVERLDPSSGEALVVATTGKRTPRLGSRVPATGSCAERTLERGQPMLIGEPTQSGHALPDHLVEHCPDCSLLALPLADGGEAVGVLFLVRDPEIRPFGPDDIAYATTFVRLAVLAFRKVYLLEESELARGEIRRLMDSRSHLMRGFSHDVKNPLGAADGYLQLLEMGVRGELEASQLEDITRARRSIRSALVLIDDLLELARSEGERVEIHRAATDVRAAASEIVDEFRARANAKGLVLKAEFPDEIPIIASDAARIHQILGNLLSNAVKYTDRGRITVRVAEREGGPAPGRWLAVDVADTGPGIPEEDRARIFGEFIRLQPAAGAGAGVGLAISRRVAKALGGEITVESEVGAGSTFTLWLPLRPVRPSQSIDTRSQS